MIDVRCSPIHGRGVFATQRVYPGRILERAPVLLIPWDERSPLADHVFAWSGRKSAVPIGKSVFLNHADQPNAEAFADGEMIVLQAVRRIERGDEVTISYGRKWWAER